MIDQDAKARTRENQNKIFLHPSFDYLSLQCRNFVFLRISLSRYSYKLHKISNYLMLSWQLIKELQSTEILLQRQILKKVKLWPCKDRPWKLEWQRRKNFVYVLVLPILKGSNFFSEELASYLGIPEIFSATFNYQVQVDCPSLQSRALSSSINFLWVIYKIGIPT